jgi:hypothetical protein
VAFTKRRLYCCPLLKCTLTPPTTPPLPQIKLHAIVFPGQHFALKLVPPYLVTGHHFGAACLLQGICNMMKPDRVKAATRHYIHSTDGGSENRCKHHHALNWMLFKFGIFDKGQGAVVSIAPEPFS